MFPRYLHIAILSVFLLLSAACAHQAASEDSPSMGSQAGDRHVLAGEWEYIDSTGAVVPLTLDEQGNGWHGELTYTSPPYG